MASWSEGRTGRHLSLQVLPEIKCHLIKIKSLTGAPIGYQITRALQTMWSDPSMPEILRPNQATPGLIDHDPVVHPSQSDGPPLFEAPIKPSGPGSSNNTIPTVPAPPPIPVAPPQSPDPYKPLLPGRYDRMREQKIPRDSRTNVQWKI